MNQMHSPVGRGSSRAAHSLCSISRPGSAGASPYLTVHGAKARSLEHGGSP